MILHTVPVETSFQLVDVLGYEYDPVGRVFVPEIDRRPLVDDPSVVHDDYLIASRSFGDDGCAYYHRVSPLGSEFADDIPDAHPDAGVHIEGGLVHDEYLRRSDYCSGYICLLLALDAQVAVPLIQQAAYPQVVGRILCDILHILQIARVQAPADLQVLSNGHHRIQHGVCENAADPFAHTVVIVFGAHIETVDGNLPGRDVGYGEEYPEQRGLAGPIAAQYCNRGPLLDLEIYPV
jgi:hypothetical protein